LAHWHTGCLKTTSDAWKRHIKTAIVAAAIAVLALEVAVEPLPILQSRL
jgi:isochorismate hydrolase